VTLKARPGAGARHDFDRLNIAGRPYRITGHVVYRDTVLLGPAARRAPARRPDPPRLLDRSHGIHCAHHLGFALPTGPG
jgi:hypothetical protein